MSAEMRKYIDSFKHKLNESLINVDGRLEDLSQDDVNAIFKGYLECALWTEEEGLRDDATTEIDSDEYNEMDNIEKIITLKGKLDKKTFTSFIIEDIDVDSRLAAYLDIKKFIKDAGDDAVKEAIEENGLFKLGMDIWFTRNGHGSGFFDHSYENEDKLIAAGKKLKSVDLYVGDDGKLYFS